MSLLLYVSAADGTLVWRGPDSLALLQPPGDRPRKPATGGPRTAFLRLLVRHWDVAVLAVPTTVLLGLAGVAAALVAAGFAAFAWPGLLLALAVLGYVAVMLGSGLVRGMVGLLRGAGRAAAREDEIAAQLLPGIHWTIVLCHHVDAGSPQHLLRRVQHRLELLLTTDVEEVAADLGVRVTKAAVTEQLVWLRSGTTTERAREAVSAWSDRSRFAGPGRAYTVRTSDFAARRPPSRVFDRGGFLFWYLAGEVLVVAVLAAMVPRWESAECGATCAGHPVTYGAAVRWLAQRLLLTDPSGLALTSRPAWVIGWLVSVMSLVGVFVAVAALRQYTRARYAVLSAAARRAKALNDRTRALIMVATTEERDAVLAAAAAVTGSSPEMTVHDSEVVWQLGTVSATQLMLVQVEPGAVGPGAAAISAAALVGKLDLDFFLLVGICYGLKPESQELGDILVCTQLRAIEHRKETEPADTPVPRSGAETPALIRDTPAPTGPRTVRVRGDYVTPSVALLSRFRAVQHSWTRPPTVHFGPMLSASTLVNSRSLRDELVAQQPEAVGGEMEGAGVYAAAAHAKVDWIVVKAICDWGFGKTDDFHLTAARNAASFVLRAAELGLLDEAPTG
ncbi:hypothetical protein GCM10010172_36700 [Paractinoplanes ferrugineus]|uniref:Nucleoside phosphorylase domain-containing protein n=1 Tax=Paractinoplanes ferrugineus TaxID=113564 RepID=A0A919IWG7_9ACTN|nr:hypothetical protein [Actinoplanes ferrugineus]GIE09267.1 hypothetical protein Afe05nite_11070 [Actinoplanes ferrugineus]